MFWLKVPSNVNFVEKLEITNITHPFVTELVFETIVIEKLIQIFKLKFNKGPWKFNFGKVNEMLENLVFVYIFPGVVSW